MTYSYGTYGTTAPIRKPVANAGQAGTTQKPPVNRASIAKDTFTAVRPTLTTPVIKEDYGIYNPSVTPAPDNLAYYRNLVRTPLEKIPHSVPVEAIPNSLNSLLETTETNITPKEWKASIKALRDIVGDLFAKDTDVQEALASGDKARLFQVLQQKAHDAIPVWAEAPPSNAVTDSAEAKGVAPPKAKRGRQNTAPLEKFDPRTYREANGNYHQLVDQLFGELPESLPTDKAKNKTQKAIVTARAELHGIVPQVRVKTPSTSQTKGVTVQPPPSTVGTDFANAVLDQPSKPLAEMSNDELQTFVTELFNQWVPLKQLANRRSTLSQEEYDDILRREKKLGAKLLETLSHAKTAFTADDGLSTIEGSLMTLGEKLTEMEKRYFNNPSTDEEAKHNLEAFLLNVRKELGIKKVKPVAQATQGRGFGGVAKVANTSPMQTLIESVETSIQTLPVKDVLTACEDFFATLNTKADIPADIHREQYYSFKGLTLESLLYTIKSAGNSKAKRGITRMLEAFQENLKKIRP